MTLPEFAHQKREQEKLALRVSLTRTLVASLAIHGALTLINFKPIWTAAEPEPEEIAIVVTEEEEPEIEEEKDLPEEDLLIGGDGGSSAPTEPETVALAEPIEPFVPPPIQEPVVELSPLATEDLTEEPIVEPSPIATPQLPAPTPPAAAVAPTPQRSIQDLLEQIRRDRDRQQPTTETSNEPTAAVGEPGVPSENGSGTGHGSASGTGHGSASGTGHGSASGTGHGSASGGDRGNSNSPAAAPGEGRRIACRNCPDVAYPEAALREQQEGTVKVLVDYDENGNVVSATLVDSSGHTVLDEAVLETVRERYRLRDTGGAGSTVVSVDMTIDGSDFNRQAEERGSRREVNMPPPAPVVEQPAQPRNAGVETIAPLEPAASPAAPAASDSLPVPAAAPQEAASPVVHPEPQPSNPVEAIEPIQETAPPPEPAYVPPSEPAYVEPPADLPPTEPTDVQPEPAYVEPEPRPPVETVP